MPLQLVGPKIKPSTTGSFVSCNYEYLVVAQVSMGQATRATKIKQLRLCAATPAPAVLEWSLIFFISFLSFATCAGDDIHLKMPVTVYAPQQQAPSQQSTSARLHTLSLF